MGMGRTHARRPRRRTSRPRPGGWAFGAGRRASAPPLRLSPLPPRRCARAGAEAGVVGCARRREVRWRERRAGEGRWFPSVGLGGPSARPLSGGAVKESPFPGSPLWALPRDALGGPGLREEGAEGRQRDGREGGGGDAGEEEEVGRWGLRGGAAAVEPPVAWGCRRGSVAPGLPPPSAGPCGRLNAWSTRRREGLGAAVPSFQRGWGSPSGALCAPRFMRRSRRKLPAGLLKPEGKERDRPAPEENLDCFETTCSCLRGSAQPLPWRECYGKDPSWKISVLLLVHILKRNVTTAICINSSPLFLGSCEKLSSALSLPLRNSWVTDKPRELKECSSVFWRDLVLFGIENLSWRMVKQGSMTSLGRKHSWKEELLLEQSCMVIKVSEITPSIVDCFIGHRPACWLTYRHYRY